MGDANRVRGRLARRDATTADVDIGGLQVALPHRGLPDGDVDLSIRPEAITLAPEGASRLRGTIRKASYLGGTMEYSVETTVGTLFVISTAVDAPMPVGARVGIVLARHGVVAIAAAAS